MNDAETLNDVVEQAAFYKQRLGDLQKDKVDGAGYDLDLDGDIFIVKKDS